MFDVKPKTDGQLGSSPRWPDGNKTSCSSLGMDCLPRTSTRWENYQAQVADIETTLLMVSNTRPLLARHGQLKEQVEQVTGPITPANMVCVMLISEDNWVSVSDFAQRLFRKKKRWELEMDDLQECPIWY